MKKNEGGDKREANKNLGTYSRKDSVWVFINHSWSCFIYKQLYGIAYGIKNDYHLCCDDSSILSSFLFCYDKPFLLP